MDLFTAMPNALTATSEGSDEELKEFIAQRKQFLQKYPDSRFAVQAKQDIADAQTQLPAAPKSRR